MLVDIIILQLSASEAHFKLLERCVSAYLQDVECIGKIIVVESNSNFDVKRIESLSEKIQVLVPNEPFNYNRFLNLAIPHTSADIVCISNNDVEMQPKCISQMIRHFELIPKLASASPVDRTWHHNSYELFPHDNTVYIGYETTKHLLGFCLFIRRTVFRIIGNFDEQFHFYHQDNDYEMCLRKHNLMHALITGCKIKHGHDKPESSDTPEQIRANLLESQQVFYRKWFPQHYK